MVSYEGAQRSQKTSHAATTHKGKSTTSGLEEHEGLKPWHESRDLRRRYLSTWRSIEEHSTQANHSYLQDAGHIVYLAINTSSGLKLTANAAGLGSQSVTLMGKRARSES